MSELTDKYQKYVQEGTLIVIRSQNYDDYIDDLEQELEDAQNSKAGADGEIPEHVISLVSKQGTIITISGKKYIEKITKRKNND